MSYKLIAVSSIFTLSVFTSIYIIYFVNLNHVISRVAHKMIALHHSNEVKFFENTSVESKQNSSVNHNVMTQKQLGKSYGQSSSRLLLATQRPPVSMALQPTTIATTHSSSGRFTSTPSISTTTAKKFDCYKIHMSQKRLPLIFLASFPGSGNTWVRHLIQQATGIYLTLYSQITSTLGNLS